MFYILHVRGGNRQPANINKIIIDKIAKLGCYQVGGGRVMPAKTVRFH